MGNDVSPTVLNFLNEGQFPKGINQTFLILIPKIKKNPLSARDYRPINLYNVVYKLVSMVLANMLKKVLPFIIYENQSAFISRHLITGNVIHAYEILYSMRAKQCGKESSMAIKLDISKAYNRIE